MDITLVRQAVQRSKNINGKEISYIDEGDISALSKSALRMLYECGKRPLFTFADQRSDDAYISVISEPQPQADLLLCGTQKNSFQSAKVLHKQMSDVGAGFSIVQLANLSDSSANSTKIIDHKLKILEKEGYNHIIIVGDKEKLNAIYRTFTSNDLPEKDDEHTCLWAIRNGRFAYTYNPKRVDFVTEGLLDSMLVSKINGKNCPEDLKIFQGKVKLPINSQALYFSLRKEAQR